MKTEEKMMHREKNQAGALNILLNVASIVERTSSSSAGFTASIL
jgi:hypothetical protein